MREGYIALVLHGHLPFVRHPEHEDSLEENWFYEAITEVYLPLLHIMEDLVEEGIDFRLTFSLTPTLLSMLLDPFLQSRYLRRVGRLVELAEKEITRTKSQPEFHALAHMYRKRFSDARDAFLDRYQGDLVGAFKRLQKVGKVEIIASAATHGYLPLLSVNPSAVQRQIRLGINHYGAVLGRKPEGFWLPECGFDPGVDNLLSEHGIRFTVLETHGITRAEPRPRYGVYAPTQCPSGVTAFGRDPDSSRQVWSSVEGYPGDHDYREFYRDIAYDLDVDYLKPHVHQDGIRVDSGIKYYRITGKTDHKEVYVPERAERRAAMHAADFIFNRGKQVEYLSSIMDRKPIIVAPYDAELFGHWWFEGPIWLNYLIRKIALEQKALRLVTLSEYLEEYPVNQGATPSMSSWGHHGFNQVWLNGSNDWIYPHLHSAADSIENLGPTYLRAEGLTLRALDQAKRELLLAQASDWAFMISSGAMTEYATNRLKTHLLRFNRLVHQIRCNTIDEPWLATIEHRDNIFPSRLLRACEQGDTHLSAT